MLNCMIQFFAQSVTNLLPLPPVREVKLGGGGLGRVGEGGVGGGGVLRMQSGHETG